MVNCTPVFTSVDTLSKLDVEVGALVSNPSKYRIKAGALQYLTMTCPELAHEQICLHMHDPSNSHLDVVKHILRYVRGIASYGLLLDATPSTDIVAYSDADWVGCLDTRCSTSG
jgi:hypothetical protein